MIQLKKFDIDKNWQPYKVLFIVICIVIERQCNYDFSTNKLFIYLWLIKLQLDVEVDMPDVIDISCLYKDSGMYSWAQLMSINKYGLF